jgi:hypothetical protein
MLCSCRLCEIHPTEAATAPEVSAEDPETVSAALPTMAVTATSYASGPEQGLWEPSWWPVPARSVRASRGARCFHGPSCDLMHFWLAPVVTNLVRAAEVARLTHIEVGDLDVRGQLSVFANERTASQNSTGFSIIG